MVLLSLLLLNKRDVGLGILPSRKGSQRAMPYLKTPLGFAWYLQKNVYIWWFISVAAMVCIIGVLVPEMSSIYESSESMKAIVTSLGGQGAIIPVFLSAMLSIVVLMIVAYVIQALDRLRSEESSGRLENMLATKLSRMRWMYFYGAVTLVGAQWCLRWQDVCLRCVSIMDLILM